MAFGEFVPHTQPMILLDTIQDFTDNKLIATVTITSDSPFFDKSLNGVETWVSMEYMSQAIAALAGVRARFRGEPVKLGFLLGTRKLLLNQAIFNHDTQYTVQVEELFMDSSGLGAFNCSIKHHNDIISEAKINVFESNDTEQLLNN